MLETGKVRTRFAPSPTGMLHFGNANTALFNWLVARHYKGTVVLRVEDTDLERSTDNFERMIMDDLAFLGIDWDEGPDKGGPFGPYRQMERTGIYEESIDKLFDNGSVFRCYCTKEEIEAARETALKEKKPLKYSGKCRGLTPEDWARLDAEGKRYTIRFKTPENEKIIVDDLIRGPIVFNSFELDDFIIVRSNGVPIFLLTNGIDDALMEITHVVRGEDHISNTPKQILINQALGLRVPQYLHTSMILGPDRTKLSKRHGAVSVNQFREQGYLSESLVNYLAFLGWNPKTTDEFFTLPELVEAFSIEAMSKPPSVFDYDRLKYINAHWMGAIDAGRRLDLCIAHLISKGMIDSATADARRDWLAEIVSICGERLKTVNDIETVADFFFRDITEYEEKGVRKHFKGEKTIAILERLRAKISALTDYTRAEIERIMHVMVDDEGVLGKELIHPARLALTGKTTGPGLFELMEVLGRDESLKRIESAEKWIAAQPQQQ